jgi:hypothetical protein
VASQGSAAADQEDGWWLYDGGLLLSDSDTTNSIPFALAIDYFAAGSPPVRWADSAMPVNICTHQTNRPSWFSAELFRDAVRDGAAMWSRAGAAVGIRYTGDCTSGTTWRDGNGVNEIAWDDDRNQVSFPSAAVTRGTWIVTSNQRLFTEADVILHRQLDVPEVCFRSVIAHELGHVIGFGHSDSPADLMYPTFNAHDAGSCPLEATANEFAWLVDLYGANQPPVIAQPQLLALESGQSVTLSVSATTSGGGALTYQWTQVAGTPVQFTVDGSSITFVAPDQPGDVLQFQVDVFDRYLAKSSVTLTAVIDEPPPPPEFGTFQGALPLSGGLALLIWDGGLVESLVFSVQAAGCDLMSAWVTAGGSMIGYTVSAPAFVNQSWSSVYPGDIPAGTPFLVVCRA